jgi:hypothetical protein
VCTATAVISADAGSAISGLPHSRCAIATVLITAAIAGNMNAACSPTSFQHTTEAMTAMRYEQSGGFCVGSHIGCAIEDQFTTKPYGLSVDVKRLGQKWRERGNGDDGQ